MVGSSAQRFIMICPTLPYGVLGVGIAYWDNHSISLAAGFEKMSLFPGSPKCSQ